MLAKAAKSLGHQRHLRLQGRLKSEDQREDAGHGHRIGGGRSPAGAFLLVCCGTGDPEPGGLRVILGDGKDRGMPTAAESSKFGCACPNRRLPRVMIVDRRIANGTRAGKDGLCLNL